MHKRHRWQAGWVVSLVLLLGTWALHLTAQEATPDTTPTALPVVEGAIGPREFPPDVNPLTGQTVDDPTRLARRPVVAKMSNSPAIVRPQAGVGEADWVYEHYTEAGITRFSGVFYGTTPERVGSVRSARLIDYELVVMYDGLLAFAGASLGVDKRIYGSEAVTQTMCRNSDTPAQCREAVAQVGPKGDIPPSDFVERAYKGVLYGRPYYWRDESLPIPHNMFVNVDALQDLAIEEELGQPNVYGLAFHDEPQGDPDGSGIYAQVRYETTLAEWHYDPDTAKYYRSTDGQIHADANTGEQVSADNVVILYAAHYLTDIVESQFENGVHWSKQITVWPAGDAVILRDGVRYNVRWLRPSRQEPLQFRTPEGDLFYLKPGNSWVQVVRTPEQMDDDSEWVEFE